MPTQLERSNARIRNTFNRSNERAKQDFINLGNDINNKIIKPSSDLLRSDDFKNGVGQGLGGVGSVVSQLSNGVSKVLSNPILQGATALLAPELVPVLAAASVGAKVGSQIGNGLEKGGTAINGKKNTVSFG